MGETETLPRPNTLFEEKCVADTFWERFQECKSITAEVDCPHCGSRAGQWRGYRTRRDQRRFHRRWCKACDSWFQEPL